MNLGEQTGQMIELEPTDEVPAAVEASAPTGTVQVAQQLMRFDSDERGAQPRPMTEAEQAALYERATRV